MSLAVLLNPDDPLYIFEHMMQHRQYFAVMPDLYQFDILPYLLDPAFHTNRAAWQWNKRHQQAHDDFNSILPPNYNNGFAITVVTPAPVTGTGTSTGTTALAVTAVSGSILIGSIIAGTGVPAGTTIVDQQSGPLGGDGTYTTSSPTTLTNIALTFTHPPYQQATAIGNETFGIPQPGILLEGNGPPSEHRAWWTFINHQQHFTANNAIMPLPTSMDPAGTGPGQANLTNPWWWAQRQPILYPFW